MCRGNAVPHALSQFTSGTLGRVQRGHGGAAGGNGGLLNVWASWGGEAGWKKRCMYIDMGLFALRATSSVNSREYPAIAFAS